MFELIEFELLSIPAIIAFVESAKVAGMSVKLAPVVAIVAGLGLGYVLGDVLNGLLFGLAASGVYSGAKEVLK